MMKFKISVLLMSLAMAVLLCGCSGTGSGEAHADSQSSDLTSAVDEGVLSSAAESTSSVKNQSETEASEGVGVQPTATTVSEAYGSAPTDGETFEAITENATEATEKITGEPEVNFADLM